MNRLPSILTLAVVAASACSSSSGGAASPQLCALASACLPRAAGAFGFSFGQECELLASTNALGGGTESVLLNAELGCLQSASDCPSFQACLAVPASAVAACKGTSSVCSQGYVVECGQRLGSQTEGQNCQGAGLVCGEGTNAAACGTATCDPSTSKPKCDGDNLVTCEGSAGVLTAADCKFATGESCSSTGTGGETCRGTVAETCGVVNGMATCVGAGAACDETTFKDRCEGTTIVSCTGGKEARFDCTTDNSNLTCKVQSTGAATCVGVGTQCTETTPETCKNGVIKYCMFGTTMTVDCKAYGLSGCTVQSSVNRPAAAACTM